MILADSKQSVDSTLRTNCIDAQDFSGMASCLEQFESNFDSLPTIIEGESKIVKEAASGWVVVRLKPTLFSLTANRTGRVEGTDQLRLRISEILWDQLGRHGIATTILAVGRECYLSEKINPPPIETIVKAAHIGTPKHKYHGIEHVPTRFGGTIFPGVQHEPYVRFDWRNKLPMADECMPLWLANQYIDVTEAERTALRAFDILRKFLSDRGISLIDICFFITADGRRIFGEVSPDCMRAKFMDDDLDKDLWRHGCSEEIIRVRWCRFLELIRD